MVKAVEAQVQPKGTPMPKGAQAAAAAPAVGDAGAPPDRPATPPPRKPTLRLAYVLLALGGAIALYGVYAPSDAYTWAGVGLAAAGALLGFLRPGPARAQAKPKRPERPHPYADEASTPAEMAHDAKNVALFWLALATGMTLVGFFLAQLFSPHLGGSRATADWEAWTEVALFLGLGLLAFGFIQKAWAKTVTMAGWLLFGFYWALVAQDLFVVEHDDYVNLAFAVLGTYFFTYLAYHQWLSEVRRVENRTVRFLNVSTFVAAGAYFVIDKIEPIRRWLIITVSDHTAWMLQAFGQGTQVNLVYRLDPNGSTSDDPSKNEPSLATFEYSDHVHTCPPPPDDWWSSFTHWVPDGTTVESCVTGLFPDAHPHEVLPVSIILACTALQSIMLFVGLFVGTSAPWKRRLVASGIVAVVVYVLNLLRNTGIVWFYGQGQASFWIMHDAIGKGGSLVAMVAIAFAAFAWFPEFLRELVGVLDLYHRDGPVERAMRLGRRRPAPKVP